MTAANDRKQGRDSEALQVAPAARQRVADHVFETLARGILKRELEPGKPLPTQRELARRFNISPLVIRQAIHRLEDIGLVRVRQGSSTTVLDPDKSSDIRLVQLRMELSDTNQTLAIDAFENQLLFLVPLLELAQRRITPEQLAVLRYIVENAEANQAGEEEARAFRIEYWRQIAAATQNSLFQQQVRWWSTLAARLDQQGKDFRIPGMPVVFGFYRRLNAALERGEGAAQLYLSSMGGMLDRFDAQRGVARARREAAAPDGAARDGDEP